jgi:hypothetical protein
MAWLGYTLEVENHGQWLRADGVEADPEWRAVDSRGHGHFYGIAVRYPTLTWIAEPCSMGHGEDCDSEGHYECATCGETVVPGTRAARDAWMDGPVSYHLVVQDGAGSLEYSFGKNEWDELQTAMLELTTERLAPFLTSRVFRR